MNNIKVISRVNGGKLSTVAMIDIARFIKGLEGKECVITIEKKRSKRSLSQNSYYHAAIVPIVQQGLKDLGHMLNKEEVHEWLKMKFNPTDLYTNDGEYLGDIPKSTTALTKTEFGEYIERIAQWCAEHLGITIPEANSQVEIF